MWLLCYCNSNSSFYSKNGRKRPREEEVADPRLPKRLRMENGRFTLRARTMFAKLVGLRGLAASQVEATVKDVNRCYFGEVLIEGVEGGSGKTASRCLVEGGLAAFYLTAEYLSQATNIAVSFDESNTNTNRDFTAIEVGGIIEHPDKEEDDVFFQPVHLYESTGHANAATVAEYIETSIRDIAATQRKVCVLIHVLDCLQHTSLAFIQRK